jgi:predicted DNA-binding protein
MEITEDKVIISRKIWEELKTDEYFREIIEIIEDSEDLKLAEEHAVDFIDYDEYKRERVAN